MSAASVRPELALGIDIGGTKIAYALTDPQGQVVLEDREPTLPDRGVADVLDRLAARVQALIAQAPGEVIGIGIGSPGHVDDRAGTVRTAYNLGWQDVPLRSALAVRLGTDRRIVLANDAAASAVGEWIYGAGQGCANFVYVALGTGLGGGAISGGRQLTGDNFFPMEIGHLPAVTDGRRCVCGLHGCVEAYCSGVGFRLGWAEQRASFPNSPLAQHTDPTTTDLLTAIRAGDPLGAVIFDGARRALIQALVWCTGILNPERIVIGGGLYGAMRDLLPLEALLAEVRARTLSPLTPRLSMVPAQVTSSALGASALVWARDAQGN